MWDKNGSVTLKLHGSDHAWMRYAHRSRVTHWSITRKQSSQSHMFELTNQHYECTCAQEVRHFGEFWRNYGSKRQRKQKICRRYPSIREGALPRGKNEEASKIIMVATTSIRESALSGAKNGENK